MAAVAFLVGQKLLNVRVPFLLSRVVDALQASEADKASQAAAAYVLGRVLTSACGELRSICFARVSFGSGRRFARVDLRVLARFTKFVARQARDGRRRRRL